MLAAGADNMATWTFLGIILRQRSPAEAETALRRAIDIDARDANARFHLGTSLFDMTRFTRGL